MTDSSTASSADAGAAVAQLVAVMDRLRSPGGCPWDAEQTHTTLVTYLVEECFELVDAIEAGDQAEICEELGDVLLQVVFHARIAQEHQTVPFSMTEVADGISQKMTRRHPHVFADATADTPDQVQDQWDAIKRQEKQRVGRYAGVATSLPALERAVKVVQRAARSGVPLDAGAASSPAGDLGDQVLGLVLAAQRDGVDLAAQLRHAVRRFQTLHP